MKQFTDQSTATRMERAKRVLRSLANGHDYRYFHGDGYPRHNDLQQDAAATLEVLEQLTKPANADVTVSRECPECGSAETEWHCTQTTNSGVVDGRLRMHDVSTVFYLGCNHCSETIRTVSGDDVAQWMNTAANRG